MGNLIAGRASNVYVTNVDVRQQRHVGAVRGRVARDVVSAVDQQAGAAAAAPHAHHVAPAPRTDGP